MGERVTKVARTPPEFHNTSFEETQESITSRLKSKQTFLGQAFEDEPFGFAYDKYGNLIPGTEARPLKVRMNDGRVLTAAEADANCFRRNRP